MMGAPRVRSAEAPTVIRLEHVRRDGGFGGGEVPTFGDWPAAWSPTRSASNVVQFARPHHADPARQAADATLSANERPAPIWAPPESRTRIAALVTFSLAVHVALYLGVQHDPEALPRTSEVPINVEIVISGDAPTGEPDVPVPIDNAKPEEEVTEPQDATTQEPQETPVAEREAAPEEPPQPQPEDPAPIAETPIRRPKPPAPKPTQKKEVAPQRTRIAAPTSPKPKQQKQKSTPQTPAARASRPANDPNYRGLVAAHLQRFKQYPADARAAQQQGIGSVSFTIDGNGRVTSASVSRGTGVASLDGELAAMVRRASPFPAPPGGHGMSFSVPVSFHLR
jgi:protein TonB